MNFDEFVQAARDTLAGYVRVSLPDMIEVMLARDFTASDIEPYAVERAEEYWTMRAGTKLPDGRIYRISYSARTGAWKIDAYHREAAHE